MVGGEEDGVVGEINEKLYSTTETTRCATAEALGPRASAAATSWPPPSATCTASTSRATSRCVRRVLKDIQDAVGAKYGTDKPFDLVFHGGSGSLLAEIREAISTTAWSR